MSVIHLNQIKTKVVGLFTNKIDLADVSGDARNLQNHFLTRALAAYSVHTLANCPVEDAALSVTDGGDDNGIDAIFFDPNEKRLFLVQSKWIHDGLGEPDAADIKKFCDGVRDLFNSDFERFNKRVKTHQAVVTEALTNPRVRYTLVLVYTGTGTVAAHGRRDLDDLLEEMNDTSEMMSLSLLNQRALHESLVRSLAGDPIDLTFTLKHWGKVDEPFFAVYGLINGTEVAKWFEDHGTRLFASNIRGMLGSTEVNEEIRETIGANPAFFWYFNNGITLIAESVIKSALGGGDREIGVFECTKVSIVNGAQTVSTLGKASPVLGTNLQKVYVPFRAISLERASPDFGPRITRANNTQNRIEGRDFVSQDPEQLRIKRELSVEGIDYVILRSENVATSEQSFDVTEATTALACASGEVSIVVQLKREIGKIWDDLTKPPYKALFNGGTNGCFVHRCVMLQRSTDAALAAHLQTLADAPREMSIGIHGNRIIAYLVFSKISQRELSDISIPIDELVRNHAISQKTVEAFCTVRDEVSRNYPNSIIPTLFKNLSKCRAIVEAAHSQMTLSPTSLF